MSQSVKDLTEMIEIKIELEELRQIEVPSSIKSYKTPLRYPARVKLVLAKRWNHSFQTLEIMMYTMNHF